MFRTRKQYAHGLVQPGKSGHLHNQDTFARFAGVRIIQVPLYRVAVTAQCTKTKYILIGVFCSVYILFLCYFRVCACGQQSSKSSSPHDDVELKTAENTSAMV